MGQKISGSLVKQRLGESILCKSIGCVSTRAYQGQKRSKFPSKYQFCRKKNYISEFEKSEDSQKFSTKKVNIFELEKLKIYQKKFRNVLGKISEPENLLEKRLMSDIFKKTTWIFWSLNSQKIAREKLKIFEKNVNISDLKKKKLL